MMSISRSSRALWKISYLDTVPRKRKMLKMKILKNHIYIYPFFVGGVCVTLIFWVWDKTESRIFNRPPWTISTNNSYFFSWKFASVVQILFMDFWFRKIFFRYLTPLFVVRDRNKICSKNRLAVHDPCMTFAKNSSRSRFHKYTDMK